jgi:hypothetical protein
VGALEKFDIEGARETRPEDGNDSAYLPHRGHEQERRRNDGQEAKGESVH